MKDWEERGRHQGRSRGTCWDSPGRQAGLICWQRDQWSCSGQVHPPESDVDSAVTPPPRATLGGLHHWQAFLGNNLSKEMG